LQGSHENRRRHRLRAHHRQPGFGLFFLMRDKGRSNRTVQALAMRVGLSITLFCRSPFSSSADFNVPKKLSMAASWQLPLRDMLCTISRSPSIRW
jgi:hypothetical protein